MKKKVIFYLFIFLLDFKTRNNLIIIWTLNKILKRQHKESYAAMFYRYFWDSDTSFIPRFSKENSHEITHKWFQNLLYNCTDKIHSL